MQLRQVQAHAASRRRLREVRRRSNPVQSPARADGSYRPRRPGRAHLVPALAAVANRHAARHDAEGTREGPLLRVLHRHRRGRDAAAVQGAADRAQISRGARAIRRRLQGRDGRRGGPLAAGTAHARQARRRTARRDESDGERGAPQESCQAPEGRQRVSRFGQQAGVDDPHHPAGHSARPASARSARRRPLRHLRSRTISIGA